MNTSRPNILFIQVDQLAAQSLRCYGDQICHSPNLDALAKSGRVYDNAYCNFPLCAPSRFSMATGMLCSKIGVFDNAAEMPASIPTYAHFLRGAGYQTALSGKMHFIGPDQHHGFDLRLTPDLYPADFSWVPNWGNEGDRDTNDPRVVLVSGVCERSHQIDFDEDVARSAISHLGDIARSEDKRPFFLQVSFTHPHDPFLCQQEFWDLYEGVDVPMPTTPAMAEKDLDPHSIRLLRDFGMLDVAFDEQDILRARRAYYGSVSFIDKLIGQILDALDATGARDNTAIVFTSDHGEMMGERGMWMKKHFFEPSLRVPLFISGPDIDAGRTRTLASLVDLLPTFMGLAEAPGWKSSVEPLDGEDLMSLDEKNDGERGVFAEYLAESTTAPIFMIRRGAYKFVCSSEDPPLLFNVEIDPGERHNLAQDTEHEAILNAFQSEAERRWDTAGLTKSIVLSQRRRQSIVTAMQQGTPVRWNHDETAQDQTPWYRGEGSYNEWAFDFVPVKKKPKKIPILRNT